MAQFVTYYPLTPEDITAYEAKLTSENTVTVDDSAEKHTSVDSAKKHLAVDDSAEKHPTVDDSAKKHLTVDDSAEKHLAVDDSAEKHLAVDDSAEKHPTVDSIPIHVHELAIDIANRAIKSIFLPAKAKDALKEHVYCFVVDYYTTNKE